MSKFELHGSRQVSEIAAGASNILQQITAIESAIENNTPSFVFDISKSLVDTICKTILEDRGKKPDRKLSSSDLLKITLKELKLYRDDVEDAKKAQKDLKEIVNGLRTAFSGICDLRNTFGVVGHGMDGYADSLENTQAIFTARATDAIVHFLYLTHKEYSEFNNESRIVYDDYEVENKQIDENFDEEAMEKFIEKFKPSEILYKLDKITYRSTIEDIRNKGSSEV